MELTFRFRDSKATAFLLLIPLLISAPLPAQETADTEEAIRIGGSMPLRGPVSYYGISYKSGIDAALNGTTIQDKAIDYRVLDDGFNPERALQNGRQMVDQNIMLLLGNVGTPNAAATLPLLTAQNIPAVAFASGSEVLDQPDMPIFNYRPDYQQEVAYVAETALAAGLQPAEICILAQGNTLGLAAVKGVAQALAEQNGQLASNLNDIAGRMNSSSPPNFYGPVGVVAVNVLKVRESYESIVEWEKRSGSECRLIVSGTTLRLLNNFIGYSTYKKRRWTFSALSVVASDAFLTGLEEFDATEDVVVTQVTPPLDAPIPAVAQAREALGNGINYISLEGFLAGKMVLAILQAIDGTIDRNAFIDAARSQPYNIGGLTIDFTNGNSGSSVITLTAYRDGDLVAIGSNQLQQILQR